MPAQIGHLHLVCGYICAGKSTLTKSLADAPQTLRISEDQWLKTLFGPEMNGLGDYITYATRLQTLLHTHVSDLLTTGVNVVLDFPANTVKQRSWMKALIEQTGCPHTLHHLDVPLTTCKQRLQIRNAQMTHEFQVTDAQFDQVSAHFTNPDPSEGFNIAVHGA